MTGIPPSDPNWNPPQNPSEPPVGQPPTGWPSPGGYPPASYPKQSQAVLALILSLVGFFCCLTAIPGAIIGRNEVKAIDAGEMDPSNRGMAQAAFIVGLIVMFLAMLSALFGIASLVLFSAGAAA